MFKRQFYAVDHADNGQDSSSDESDLGTSDDDSDEENEEVAQRSGGSSDDEAAASEEGSDEDEDDDDEMRDSESEDEEWSAFRDRNIKVVQPIDSSYFLSKKSAEASVDGKEHTKTENVEEPVGDGVVLRIRGVLKCRLCVKVLCLSDETMKAHLQSKRHAKSLKRLAAGKLKVQLNSDGEEEDEAETHAERLERIRRVAEEKVEPVKSGASSGRRNRRKRAKLKASSSIESSALTTESTPTAETPKSNRKARRVKGIANGSDKKPPNRTEAPSNAETPKNNRKARRAAMFANGSDKQATAASPIVASTVKVSKAVEIPSSINSPKVTNASDKKSRDETKAVHAPKATLKGPKVTDRSKNTNSPNGLSTSVTGVNRSVKYKKKNSEILKKVESKRRGTVADRKSVV